MAATITATNLKGGVGKTTFVVTMADALAREKRRVLVIDMDGQGNTSRTLSQNVAPPELSMADVLLSRDEETLRKALRKDTRIPGVHHIPARIKMHNLGYAEEVRGMAPNPYKVLRRRLESLQSDYDFILIDTPPRIDLLTLNALAAADAYVIPFLSGDIYALDGTDDMSAAIERFIQDSDVNPNLELLGAVLQQHSGVQNACKITHELVADRFDIFGIVPANTNVKQAAMINQTVMQYDRRSSAAGAYVDMACKILEKYGFPRVLKRGRKKGE